MAELREVVLKISTRLRRSVAHKTLDYSPDVHAAQFQLFVTVQNLNTFTGVEVSLYTPCTINIANNAGFNGQVIGGTVVQTNQTTLSYKPVLIPGMSIVGFQQDIAYIREVPVS